MLTSTFHKLNSTQKAFIERFTKVGIPLQFFSTDSMQTKIYLEIPYRKSKNNPNKVLSTEYLTTKQFSERAYKKFINFYTEKINL